MKTQTNVGSWIGTLVMGVVAIGVLTVEEGDMLLRAVATAATAIIGAALIVTEAWQRRTATQTKEGEVGVTEIVIEAVTFDLSPENLQELGQIAYEAYGDLRGWKAWDGKPMSTWAEVNEGIKTAWAVSAEAIATKLEEALREGGEATHVEDILRAFPTRDLVQALTQRAGVERHNLPLESEDGPAILLKIVD